VSPTANERAVSPVIATILMVAIVVVLAAVIGSFVFGVSTPSESPPRTSITIEEKRIGNGVPKDDALVFEHQAGETFTRGNIAITVGGDEVFNNSVVSDVGGGGTVVVELQGLVVEVDSGPFNDLNKPGDGPPSQGDGDSSNVVNQWGDGIDHGDKLVIQERNNTKSYDVINEGDRVKVLWTDPSGEQFLLKATTVGE
jgi:flagellin-like protein